MGNLGITILLFAILAGQIYWGVAIGLKLIDVNHDINMRLINIKFQIDELNDK